MTITCFYQQAGTNPQPEIDLVKLWERAWLANGWHPITLTEDDAKKHPLYNAMVEKADSLPRTTDKVYHRYCFVRWLAYSLVGGCVADYDVFPRTLFRFAPCNHSINGSLTLQPGFVFAPKEWFTRYIQTLLNYKTNEFDLWEGKPHVCDMVVMRSNPQMFNEITDLVRLVNEPGWRTVPLVHFANNNFKHRYQGVRALLDL